LINIDREIDFDIVSDIFFDNYKCAGYGIGNKNMTSKTTTFNYIHNLHFLKFKHYISVTSALLLALVLVAGLFTFGCNGKHDKKPNIVVIVIDTLRADHLPFYGYSKNTAPFLNSLAEKSPVFEKTFSASSWTAPSTASIFTSFYPFQHGVMTNMLATRLLRANNPNKKIKLNRIPDAITCLGEIMKDSGFSTYMVSDNINIGEKENFTQGFDKFATFSYETADVVNNTIKEWAEEIKAQKQYFLYIHYMDPHQPLYKREPWYQPQKDEKLDMKAKYDAEISFVDQKIKEMFDLFQWDKNTLVVVTSDHGEEFWDHGKTGHGHSLYKELIHVPLFFYYPDPEKGFKGKRILGNTSLLDILPTLRDFLGMEKDPYNEGISLLPFIRMEEAFPSTPKRHLFSHIIVKRVRLNDVVAKSVVYAGWHAYSSFYSETELYNFAKDPEELKNQYPLARGKEIYKQLMGKFHEFYSKCKKFKQEIVEESMSKKEMDKLRSLGYVE
jgi:choline-sulfatase